MPDTPNGDSSNPTPVVTEAPQPAPEAFEGEDLEFFPGLDSVIAKHLDGAPADEGEAPAAEAPTEEAEDGAEEYAEYEEPAEEAEEAEEDEGEEALVEDTGEAEEPDADDEPDLSSKQRAYLTNKEAELLRRDQGVTQREAAVQRLLDDPVEGLKDLGLNPDDVAALILYKSLGEDAPPELKQRFERQSVDARLRALEEGRGPKQPTREEPAESGAFTPAEVQALDREIAAFSQNLPPSMPFLSASAEEDLRATYHAICQVAEASLMQGKWLSAVEAAKQLEGQLRSDWERFSKLQPTKKAESTKGTRKRKKTKKVPTEAASKRKPKRRPLEDEADPYSDRFEERAVKVLESFMVD